MEDKEYLDRIGAEEDAESRAYTKEEVRSMFYAHMRSLVTYWANLDLDTEEKIEGALFSMLVMMDGGTLPLPLMDVTLRPHPEDEQYYKSQGENWFEDGMVINDDCMLHELWHKEKQS